MLQKLIKSVTNLIKWFPIIWNDEDWDYNYLYKILTIKLENMEKYFVSDKTLATSSKQTGHELMVVKNLAKRLANDNYLENALTEYNKLYKDKDLFGSEPSDNPRYTTLVEVGTKHQHDMFRRAGKYSEIMKKQDKIMLFDLIKKNIDGWWD